MTPCQGQTERIHRYLDAELPPEEAFEFEKHLLECRACRAVYQNVRAVSDLVRGARPMYVAPESSYQQSRQLIESVQSRRVHSRWLLAAAGAVAAAAVLLWRPPEPPFPDFASAAHQRFSSREGHLGIASHDPQAVTRWLSPRLDFPLRLPDYPAHNGGKPYRLTGAGVLDYRGRKAALIRYEMGGRPITLLMTSSPAAAPGGGELYRSGKLIFHFHERNGLHIISWTDKATHYALVSELGGRGSESCTVCHGGATGRRFLEGLEPSRRN
jgi:anti-sigma factor RsiW